MEAPDEPMEETLERETDEEVVVNEALDLESLLEKANELDAAVDKAGINEEFDVAGSLLFKIHYLFLLNM